MSLYFLRMLRIYLLVGIDEVGDAGTTCGIQPYRLAAYCFAVSAGSFCRHSGNG